MGWYMLAIAILYPKQISIEDAESIFYTGKRAGRAGAGRKTDDHLNRALYEARQKGMTYKEIGLLYGMDMHAVFKRIKRTKGVEIA